MLILTYTVPYRTVPDNTWNDLIKIIIRSMKTDQISQSGNLISRLLLEVWNMYKIDPNFDIVKKNWHIKMCHLSWVIAANFFTSRKLLLYCRKIFYNFNFTSLIRSSPITQNQNSTYSYFKKPRLDFEAAIFIKQSIVS